jgi:hypothetical protein
MNSSDEARRKVLARFRARMDRIEALLAGVPTAGVATVTIVEPLVTPAMIETRHRNVAIRSTRQGLRQRASA